MVGPSREQSGPEAQRESLAEKQDPQVAVQKEVPLGVVQEMPSCVHPVMKENGLEASAQVHPPGATREWTYQKSRYFPMGSVKDDVRKIAREVILGLAEQRQQVNNGCHWRKEV